MPGIIGLTLVKIDGVFELMVTNVNWTVDRQVTQQPTGGGIENALAMPFPSGGMDEAVAKDGATDWLNKSNFRIDIYDKETRSKIVHSQSGCEWNKVDGSSENQSAMTKQKISWKGKTINALTTAG